MFDKIAKLILGGMMAVVLTSCEKPDDRRGSIVEANLIRSFRDESPEDRQKIAKIIRDAQARKYKIALNELALFSDSRILTDKQKFDVEATMRILRYNMEEEIFSRQKQQKQQKQQ
ncbi:MAG: hypothetical protein GXP02_07675, partial [Alphaproteobacteria bacterium]|nr:hypothetical protein [Alphaproteobacteria bacterium]